MITNTDYISSWKSKGLSSESFKPPATSDNSFVPVVLSLHYNGANSYLFVNGTEIFKFKAKDSEIVASPLCLGNISKDW